MNIAELIDALRNHRTCDTSECETCELMDAAAAALEAAEKQIADLETALAACRARRGEQE